jgi:hypothetical protein
MAMAYIKLPVAGAELLNASAELVVAHPVYWLAHGKTAMVYIKLQVAGAELLAASAAIRLVQGKGLLRYM